jgi:hypothetical protein
MFQNHENKPILHIDMDILRRKWMKPKEKFLQQVKMAKYH